MPDAALLPTRAARHRWTRFPLTRGGRWGMRLGLAAPFAVLAALTWLAPGALDTRNEVILGRAGVLDWTVASVEWLADLYPPVPKLIAALALATGTGPLLLGLVGAFAAGILLQRAAEIMVQRRMPGLVTIALLVALAANPLFAYLSVTNLPVFLALATFGHGLGEAVRFVRWNDTRAGFLAGTLFLFAGFCDVSALLFVAIAGVTVPFLVPGRRDQRGAWAANILVLLFPLVTGLLAWLLLQAVFTGDPFRVGQVLFADPVGRLGYFFAELATTAGFGVTVPLAASVIVALYARDARVLAVAALLFVGIAAGYAFGIITATGVGTTYLLAMLIACAMLPRPTRPASIVLLLALTLSVLAGAWIAGLSSIGVTAWARPIGGWLAAIVGG